MNFTRLLLFPLLGRSLSRLLTSPTTLLVGEAAAGTGFLVELHTAEDAFRIHDKPPKEKGLGSTLLPCKLKAQTGGLLT